MANRRTPLMPGPRLFYFRDLIIRQPDQDQKSGVNQSYPPLAVGVVHQIGLCSNRLHIQRTFSQQREGGGADALIALAPICILSIDNIPNR